MKKNLNIICSFIYLAVYFLSLWVQRITGSDAKFKTAKIFCEN